MKYVKISIAQREKKERKQKTPNQNKYKKYLDIFWLHKLKLLDIDKEKVKRAKSILLNEKWRVKKNTKKLLFCSFFLLKNKKLNEFRIK